MLVMLVYVGRCVVGQLVRALEERESLAAGCDLG